MLRIAITGRPGIGKTTFCLKVFNALKERRKVCGFITTEVREKGVRKGFKLVDLVSGREDWLARVNSNSAVRVGKYGVIVDSIDNFARNLGCENSELAIIDEIGPMELKSKVFVSTIEDLLSSSISCLFSIHLRSRHRLLERIRREFEVFTLSEDNRNTLVDEIVRLYENSGR